MRRNLAGAIFALWVAAAPIAATAQAQPQTDTAALIVDRYAAMTSLAALPPDSMLVAETVVTSPGSADTLLVRRWFAPPQMQRVEVWHGAQLQTALCTNGKTRYREYKPDLGYWEDIPADAFHEHLSGYDIRGPLHNWRAAGTQLAYRGKVEAKEGRFLEAVRAETPGMFDRFYMFEPSGLLTLIVETDHAGPGTGGPGNTDSRIDWKVMHEYQYAGPCLLPKQESFMRQGTLTVLTTTARLAPRSNLVFNQD